MPALEQQLEPELPATQDPQLPEIIAATTVNTDQDQLKNEPQTVTAAESESPEQITSSTNTESSMKKRKIGRSSSTNKTTAARSKSSKIKKKSK
jgi:hypothetical protein